MLEKISSPADLSHLKQEEIKQLAEEIRNELIKTVSENGGHLASNLGAVELTIALHRTFHAPEDKIIFDVGHQSYVHKLLTGRFEQFHTLREYGGIAGFPRRDESEYDCFETGHASTSVSAALGMARARDFLGEKHHVIAVTGDGAMTGGMCYEALNDAGHSRTRIIVILNDNEMSIAENVGALSKYLTGLRISAGWQKAKSRVRRLNSIPVVGKGIYRMIHGSKKLIKTVLVHHGNPGFFEALGIQYFGPINGHDTESMEATFEQAKLCPGPCLIHVITRKGYGYEQAEEKPEKFHGTPPFYIETGKRITEPGCPSAGHVMADTLAEMCEKDPRIIAITAAMKLGTGLDHFAEKFPDRLIDVGIAEEHAATMAAGLAAGGMRPYFAVYSTFFQRCFDQMLHDVAMQNLPVVFLLDRSGIGGEDGRTHHGVFDLSETLPVPGVTVTAPCDPEELKEIIKWTIEWKGPCIIRYSKGGKTIRECHTNGKHFTHGKWNEIIHGKDYTILAVGSMLETALQVQAILSGRGIAGTVVNCSTLKPADMDYLSATDPDVPIFTLEEHMIIGGFGEYISGICMQKGWPVPKACFGVADCYINHGKHEQLIEEAGLSAAQVGDRIFRMIRGMEDCQGKSVPM